MLITLVLLGIIAALLVVAVVQWTRYLHGLSAMRRQVNGVQESVTRLIEALTEDFDGNDVILSLRESKHFTANDQQLVHTLIDEIHVKLGLPRVKWSDREEERQKFLELYHSRLTQQGPS